jgi:adenosylmethionine-8-amino-7-oxononanoate aminotransferase
VGIQGKHRKRVCTDGTSNMISVCLHGSRLHVCYVNSGSGAFDFAACLKLMIGKLLRVSQKHRLLSSHGGGGGRDLVGCSATTRSLR